MKLYETVKSGAAFVAKLYGELAISLLFAFPFIAVAGAVAYLTEPYYVGLMATMYWAGQASDWLRSAFNVGDVL